MADGDPVSPDQPRDNDLPDRRDLATRLSAIEDWLREYPGRRAGEMADSVHEAWAIAEALADDAGWRGDTGIYYAPESAVAEARAQGAAQERARWVRGCAVRADASREAARLCRGDGLDEQAEIYVGQALAYETLPGLLDGSVTRRVVACPVCGSRDEYPPGWPSSWPAEHTCGHVVDEAGRQA
jgi:hypothetical protein